MKLLDTTKNKKGQTLVEYALILILISVLAIVAMKVLGGNVNNMYNEVGSKIPSP